MSVGLFALGRVVGTPGALASINDAGIGAFELLRRHHELEPGDLCADDIEANKQALIHDTRILSSYKLPNTGVKVWVITEADRSVTTLLLPEEY